MKDTVDVLHIIRASNRGSEAELTLKLRQAKTWSILEQLGDKWKNNVHDVDLLSHACNKTRFAAILHAAEISVFLLYHDNVIIVTRTVQ